MTRRFLYFCHSFSFFLFLIFLAVSFIILSVAFLDCARTSEHALRCGRVERKARFSRRERGRARKPRETAETLERAPRTTRVAAVCLEKTPKKNILQQISKKIDINRLWWMFYCRIRSSKPHLCLWTEFTYKKIKEYIVEPHPPSYKPPFRPLLLLQTYPGRLTWASTGM